MLLKQFPNKTNGQKGFTLAELLVVVSILGLLASIILVATSGATERPRIAKTLQWSQGLHSLLGADVVGIWRLNENPASHGTIIEDISGRGNHGTLWTNDGAMNKAVPGVVGGALSFDGVNDYVGVDSLVFTPNQLTVSAWVYPSANVKQHVVSDVSSFGLRMEGTNNWNSFIYNGTKHIHVFYSETITPQWYFLTFTFDGATLKLYRNGILIATNPAFTGTPRPTTYLAIGARGTNDISQIWNGLIDEVRIYNRALTLTEIQKHYAQGLNKLLVNDAISKEEYSSRIAEFNQPLVFKQ